MRKGKDIDLGPLVGSTRGFRTKERVPMSGGLGGMEMDNEEEVPVVRIQNSSPPKRSAKGKEKAVEGDVDMLVDVEERGRSKEMKSLCFIFLVSSFLLLSFFLSFYSLGQRWLLIYPFFFYF